MISIKEWEKLEKQLRKGYFNAWAEDYMRDRNNEHDKDIEMDIDPIINAVIDFVECRRIEKEEGEE